MEYHVYHEGRNLGVFPLEELQRRRQTGEYTGAEYVWREGMPGWEPLDSILHHGVRQTSPPPLRRVKHKKRRLHWMVPVILFGLVLLLVAVAFGAYVVNRQFKRARDLVGNQGVSLANQKVAVSTNGMTRADVRRRGAEFRKRLWLDAYEENGDHRQSWDDDARGMIGAWIEKNYGSPATNAPDVADWCDRIAAKSGCDDPLVLTVAGLNAEEQHEKARRLERALAAYPKSKYLAYPRLNAVVGLLKITRDRKEATRLNAEGVRLARECFADGSFRPEDQAEVAEIFVHGWANEFFTGNGSAIYHLPADAGKSFEWLAHVFDGEYHIDQGWKARGNGWANSVTDKGWQSFEDHLTAARESYTQAWKMRPELPLPPTRMITVAMGESDPENMRVWFDRALDAQVDCPEAWNNMSWALRPRWFGSLDAMLALGKSAVATGRFDTDAPHQFVNIIYSMESEMELRPGEHLYGRSDIWPTMSRMYQGYIAEPSQSADQTLWRSRYSTVAYLAGKYDVARSQLEAIQWQPLPRITKGWGRDLTLMPQEVAARTGKHAKEIIPAESSYQRRRLDNAVEKFKQIAAVTDIDPQTSKFVQARLATLAVEERLSKGEWVNLQPATADDPAWAVQFGTIGKVDRDSVDIESDKHGHMLYSRARIGGDFEVRGEFEIVKTSNGEFQAGLVMGLPDFESRTWYAFRMKRNAAEGQVASFANGWSAQQVAAPIFLDSKRNTFQFRLKNGQATATVNGKSVLHDASLENFPINVNPADYVVGLGAFNDMNGTVIRYHNVQIRRL
ncbi:DUF4339 domain-containing protein [bacterium]|nr:DUF4339 domain-containing protein [bacterium]